MAGTARAPVPLLAEGPGLGHGAPVGLVTNTGSTRVPRAPERARGGSAWCLPALGRARLAPEHRSEGLRPWPSQGRGGPSPSTARGNGLAQVPAEPARPPGRAHAACSSCQTVPTPWDMAACSRPRRRGSCQARCAGWVAPAITPAVSAERAFVFGEHEPINTTTTSASPKPWQQSPGWAMP